MATPQQTASGQHCPLISGPCPDNQIYEHLKAEHGWTLYDPERGDLDTCRAMHRVAIENIPANGIYCGPSFKDADGTRWHTVMELTGGQVTDAYVSLTGSQL
jgi:hypothetical protein